MPAPISALDKKSTDADANANASVDFLSRALIGAGIDGRLECSIASRLSSGPI
jgi:hypothetical protein